jgi:pimeloyl-ACP methyl ester carboxylesterase
MANFVLVHGAWHGAWCWRKVTSALIQNGHRAHAVTLTGLGERMHLLSPNITLETHISDVFRAIEAEELGDVILVVHSYAGMLGTAIADRHRELLKHLVYVDAIVPNPGESWSSTHADATQKARRTAMLSSPNRAIPPPDPVVFGLSGGLHDWVKRRQTPHPGQTYDAPLNFDPQRVAQIGRTFVSCTAPALPTTDAMRTRVVDSGFWDGAWLPGSRTIDLETGHDAMVSAPDELVRILLNCTA